MQAKQNRTLSFVRRLTFPVSLIKQFGCDAIVSLADKEMLHTDEKSRTEDAIAILLYTSKIKLKLGRSHPPINFRSKRLDNKIIIILINKIENKLCVKHCSFG